MLEAPEAAVSEHFPIACRRGIFPPAELDESLSVLASPKRACFVQTHATPCKQALLKLGPFLLIDLGRREIWSGSDQSVSIQSLEDVDGIHKFGFRNSQGIDVALAHALRPDRSIRTSVGVGRYIFRERVDREAGAVDVGWSVSSVVLALNKVAREAGYQSLLSRAKLGGEHGEYSINRRANAQHITLLVKSPEWDVLWPPAVVMDWADREFTNAVSKLRCPVLDRATRQ